MPLNVSALERRSTPAVGFEHAEHHFAAYRPPTGGSAATALALVGLGAGGLTALTVASTRRRRPGTTLSRRGDIALAETQLPRDPEDDRR